MKGVDFNIIRYANCWEDADILLKGLAPAAGSTILSIASAGDNSLALLTTAPKEVYAIDISKVQLYLTELKQCAFAHLEYNEMRQLLSVDGNNEAAVKLYKKLRDKLSAAGRQYWDEHLTLIRNGILNSGKFEGYFHKFHSWFLPLVHSKRTVQQLLQLKTIAEQEAFYNETWNTWRWRLLMRIFFSKYVMGKYGRDPKFLAHVKLSVPEYIRQKAEGHLRSHVCSENYFLQMAFTGRWGMALPFYLRQENFENIKANIYKLSLHNQSADEAIAAKSFDACNLSNIFEYMSEAEFAAVAQRWSEVLPKGCRLAYWNLMAGRCFSEIMPQWYRHCISGSIFEDDKGFFYSRFLAEEKI